LQSHLTLFAVAAVALVLTAALADAYHSLRQRRTHR
jgi:hypothetical protein